jgi:outer membrane receptor protein involved in Fe transport
MAGSRGWSLRRKAVRHACGPLLFVVLAHAHAGPLRGQEPARGRATVAGRVLDAATGQALVGATVVVEGTRLHAVADTTGRFVVAGVPAGPQVLRGELLGYAAARVMVTVPVQGVLVRDVVLAVSALQMEGITVTADPTGRARGELGTASVIGREAIEHQTAASLAGLLELLPGVPLQPPGLDGVQQISLRTVPTTGGGGADPSTGALGSFGTLIVIDGVPLSNNANLQSTGARGEVRPVTSAGGGIDLRQVPAGMIERIEVIRGVPSARYGDLTQGAVVVETRAGAIPAVFTTLYDARTRALSGVGGSRLFHGHSGTALLDATRTRTLGLATAESRRTAAQLSHRAALGGDGVERGAGGTARLVLDTRADLFEVRDDAPPTPTLPGRFSSGHERGARLSERLRLELGPETRLEWTASLAFAEQNARRQTLLVRGALPFTDRLTEGRQIGRFVGGQYPALVELEGKPRLVYQRLELSAQPVVRGFEHRLRGGLEARREWNAGTGYQFDLEFPPQAGYNAVGGYDRPRPFSAVPPLASTALYLDDYVHVPLGRQALLNLQGGLRLDVLHEGTHWLSGARDVALQPRFNAELAPVPALRLRGAWGSTAKLPSLAQLHPAPQYYDVVNVNWYTADPAERLAVVTTFIRDPANPELGFSRSHKAEAGVEVGLGGASAIGLTFFSDRVAGGVGNSPRSFFLLRERFELTDSMPGTGRPPALIEPAVRAETVPVILDRPANNITARSRGLELSATLPELRPLRTRLQVQGVRVSSRVEKDDVEYRPTLLSDFQLSPALPRRPGGEAPVPTGGRTLMTYRLVHHQPAVGLVVTATVQHYVREHRQDIGGTDTLAWAGYMTRDGHLVPVAPERRGDPEYAGLRVTRSGLLTALQPAPADWLLGLQVSKTLPLAGRFSFYAFNALDRPGTLPAAQTTPRLFPATRFGLDVALPAAALRELWHRDAAR